MIRDLYDYFGFRFHDRIIEIFSREIDMSFSIEFTAKNHADARAIIMKSHAPITIKDFLMQAITAGNEDEPIYVKAMGHLFEPRSYEVSNAVIDVRPFAFTPPPPA